LEFTRFTTVGSIHPNNPANNDIIGISKRIKEKPLSEMNPMMPNKSITASRVYIFLFMVCIEKNRIHPVSQDGSCFNYWWISMKLF
jgi:hypothetical protein